MLCPWPAPRRGDAGRGGRPQTEVKLSAPSRAIVAFGIRIVLAGSSVIRTSAPSWLIAACTSAKLANALGEADHVSASGAHRSPFRRTGYHCRRRHEVI